MKENFQEALDLGDRDGKLRKTIWGQFWSSHQRFFKYLCMACKVPHVVKLARKALASKKCVVIGLQSTGEARTLEQLDECGEISDFVSTARGVLQNLVEKYFPLIDHQTGSIKANKPKMSSAAVAVTMMPHKAEQNSANKVTGGKAKNSKNVNNILKRLSSYASRKTVNNYCDQNGMAKKSSKRNNQRTSSMSSVSSNDDKALIDDEELSLDDSFKLNDSEFDEESDDGNDEELFESSFDHEFFSSESSNDEDDLNLNELDLDTFFKPKILVSNDQNDSGISFNSKSSASMRVIPASDEEMTNVKTSSILSDVNKMKEDSDDSDSLFSITKSVSVQSMIKNNNQSSTTNRRKKAPSKLNNLGSEEKTASRSAQNVNNKRLNRKKSFNFNLPIDKTELHETEEAVLVNEFYSSDESDYQLKLPIKRLKSSKITTTMNRDKDVQAKNEEIIEDQFSVTFAAHLMQKQARNACKPPTSTHEIAEYLHEIKSNLLNSIQQLGKQLPPNTLDELIDRLDGPDKVAEMTGRKGRVVCRSNLESNNNNYVYETRNEVDVPVELMNVVQKERFMSGEKLIAIISEAASSGISLQANRRYANQRRRVHITVELPWSADRAIQQFGRTHRSNQINAPEYVFLISELAGEKRFASTVAKRLESLVN